MEMVSSLGSTWRELFMLLLDKIMSLSAFKS